MSSEQRQPAVAVPAWRRRTDASAIAPAVWREAIERVVVDTTQPVLAFQPIADLARGTVVGYEALARFGGPPVAPPDEWFRAAVQLGHGPALEARVIADALASREALPPDCFLSVNVSPDVLLSPPVSAAFAAGGVLDRLVVELTEHAASTDFAAVVARLARLRDLGAYIAIDDAGTGHSGLTRILEVRPSFVKLDRGLVVDIDRDPAKRALVEMIGTFAGRIDSWIIAEGIERLGELEELVRLGVPLGQGYLLGRPAPRWSTGLPPALLDAVLATADRREDGDSVARLVERTPSVGGERLHELPGLFLDDPGLEAAVVVDAHARPVALHTRAAAVEGARPNRRIVVVRADTPIAETAERAMTRERPERFDPVICCDGLGAYLGTVGIDRLLLAVSRRSS